jgi:hypothetical protein
MGAFAVVVRLRSGTLALCIRLLFAATMRVLLAIAIGVARRASRGQAELRRRPAPAR